MESWSEQARSDPRREVSTSRWVASRRYPDAEFGDAGLTSVDFYRGDDLAHATAIQTDGKIVLAGEAFDSATNNSDFALARFRTEGSLDESFGSGGTVTTDLLALADHAFGVGIQSGGKIVAVDVTGTSNANDDFARYNDNGSLDTTFGEGGRIHTDFLNSRDVARAMVIQSDGKFVVAGSMSGNFALARYNVDGSIDPSFGWTQNGEPQPKTFNGDSTPSAMTCSQEVRQTSANNCVLPDKLR